MTILKKAPAGAQVLDIGAGRAARAEARAAEGLGSPFLKISAGFIAIKAEIPVEVAYTLQSDVKAGLAGLLVDPSDIDSLFADGLTKEDLEAITALITGKPLGESLASPTL